MSRSHYPQCRNFRGVLDIGATNVEIAKRNVDAFNRLDVDGFVESTTPDFEWFPVGARHLSAAAFWGARALKSTSRSFGTPGRRSDWSRTSFVISATAPSFLGGSRDGDGRAAPRWSRRLGRYSTFAAASARASAPSPITTRRRGQRASPSSRQVPVAGGCEAEVGEWPRRVLVTDASVPVKTAETPQLDDVHSSVLGRTTRSLRPWQRRRLVGGGRDRRRSSNPAARAASAEALA